ncbi:MAG: tetratricopeptide repeat protein [Tannerella sp.]|jgi:tetratricopeptide (TPR) repeat protein|nr:tetratricopeptide repeat protein [Tannerella sp.]
MSFVEIKKRLYIVAASVIVIVALGSCGARKNTASSRFYHSLNSRYNIYFNGKTTFDEALKSMNEGYKENYSEQIHMFPISGIYREEKSVAGGPFDRAIEKGNKAIKLHSIKEKPPRKAGWQSDPKQVKLQAQEEFNPFMKHCWLLIAEGQFYNGDFLTSAVTFSYIARHFTTDPELVAEALVWQARCYTEMDWFYETNNALKKLGESGIPPKLQKKYDRMYADYLIRSKQLEQAIPYLQNAVKSEKNKRQRSRMHYLLGQIYMNTGRNEEAYRTFGKLASSNPPYEIEFASRIRQTEVFPGGNYGKVLKMLKRMAKSDKNKDFLDQVYYAMGNVYMTQQDTARAIECYAEGIEKSTQNGMDKAICQIRLGDIYFTQKDYLKAQPCFSGALAGIQREYKDYDRVARLSETLDELVIHFEAVHLQDSLQELARMPESERLAVIDKIIEQVIEEEKKAEEEAKKEEFLADQQALGSNLPSRNNIAMPQTPTNAGDNSFYFYNQQVVAQGKTQFQNRWGKRTLEDNWRRRNKKMALIQTDDEQAASTDAPGEISEDMNLPPDSLPSIPDSLASDPKSREYYLQQIPFAEEDLEASNMIVANGLFNMGMIYKDKLENVDLSVETFEELERRFPDNEYKLDYYYQIYIMALRYKNTALAEKYKNRMLAEFPDNDYTIAISDPDYEYNIRMMDSVQDSIYEATYTCYLAKDTSAVRRNYLEVSAKYPLAKLMPKFMFLNALTYVQAGDSEGFKEELTLLTEKYPGADVTELANEMLKGLLRGRKLMQGSFSTMTWDLRFGLSEDGTLSAADSARTFSAEQETPHRMLLIHTAGSIDRNLLLYAIAAYNFANFRVKGFDLSFEESGSLTLFTISGFNSLGEIIEYYRMIYGEGGYASAFDGVATFFPISDENYMTLMHGKTLEEYMTFFIENYGETAPELVNRWRVRVETDRKAEEEKLESEEETITEPAATPAEPAEPAKDEPKKTEPEILPAEPVTIKEEIPVATERPVEQKEETTENEDAPQTSEPDTVPEERPKAKRDNIFKKLFKRVKDTDEFKKIQEGINVATELAAENELPADSAATNKKPLERADGELTFEQLQEIRRQETEEAATKEAEETLSKEEAKKAAQDQKKQQEKANEQLRKDKEKAAKERLKQKEKERKQKEKERKAALKQKEKERRAAQKEKAAQRNTKKSGK